MKTFKAFLLIAIPIFSLSTAFALSTVDTTISTKSYICTADAKLCPDGSYVGRTGPKCEFVCPVGDLPGDEPPVIDLCIDLKNNLYIRSTDAQTGGEVSLLQEFLAPNYFSQEAMGYFGQFTFLAVQKFQTKNSIRGTGYVGPVTRAKIKELSCSGATTPQPQKKLRMTSMEPNTAKIGETVTLYGYGFSQSGTEVTFGGYPVKATPVYLKRMGDFDSALSFVVPENLNTCRESICLMVASKPVVAGETYVVEVKNKLGSDARKFVVAGATQVTTPTISALSPATGTTGTLVTITGSNINTGSEKIYFGGSLVMPEPTYDSDRKGVLRFKIPQTITPCGYDAELYCKMMAQNVENTTYIVVIKNKYGFSNELKFSVTK